MPIVCPRCRRNLPSSEEPPRYCSFCGQRLREDSPPGLASDSPGDGSTIAQSPSADLPSEETMPSEIGGYRLQRLLGVGGMGRVFEAESTRTGQKVAVKLLSTQLTRNPTTVERFRQEGRLASQLSHPRCVFVLEADTENGRPYIVMELMPGDTVKDLLDRRGPLPAREAIPIILDVIEGLQEAHRFGVIHRDVKPSNCFLMPDGRVKIGDFGLSKSLGADGRLTQSGAFLGTVLYASPEQIRGEPVDYASDVYSVCATLYHMLTGQPPFHHENITAALAKIISEDAPSVLSIKPDAPRALAKVVEKGLERDRNRRWQTLEELRAALVALVPSHLTYGGLTVRVGAYVLDEVLVRLLVVVPLSAIQHVNPYLTQLILCIYFILLEGIYGASLGKRLLRLRVCRTGSTDPPGLKLAALRTLTFFLLITVTLMPAQVLYEQSGGGWGGVALAAIPFTAGLLLLIVPMRKKNDFRGLHELVSGTCVMKLPRRANPLTLVSKRQRLLSMPAAHDPLPAALGPYSVKGAVASANHEYTLVAEDALLNRRVLVRLRPAREANPFKSMTENSRPTRARVLNHGDVTIHGVNYVWDAYVAPAGAALGDIVAAKGRLTWPETRPLLEQLADELCAAETDGTLPATLSLDQVWVQRDGRLQLLDFPVTAPGEPEVRSTGSLDLLRDVATLALEGQVRLAGAEHLGPIRAPLPRHASEFLDRLVGGPNPFGDVGDARAALQQTRDLPTHIDPPLRIAQLTVQAVLLAAGLGTMFLVSGLFAVVGIVDREQYIRAERRLLEALDDPQERSRLAEDPRFAKLSADDDTLRATLRRQLEEDQAEAERLRTSLSALERSLLPLLDPPGRAPPADSDWLALERATASPYDQHTVFARFGNWRDAFWMILAWPVLWAVGALVLRGGLSYQLLGISLVDREGRPLSRRRCALRTLVVWLPVALLLCGSVWFQANRPTLVSLHALMWLAAFMLLPVYLALALPDPDRPPHDRLLGSTLVPR